MPVRGCLGTALILAAIHLQVGLAAPARAQEQESGGAGVPAPSAPATDAAPARNFVSNRNIRDSLEETRRSRESLVSFGIRDAALRLEDRVYRATRIRFSSTYTLLYQRASEGNGPLDATGGDFDLFGLWAAIQTGGKTTGSVEVAFEGRHKAGSLIPPAALSTTIDSLWPTTSGFNIQTLSLIQLYWRQDLFNDRLHYSIGKLSPYSSFFGNRINSSSLFFVNYAFSDNPAVFMPGNGLAIHVKWDFSSRWSVTAGIQNANAIKTEIDPSTLRFGEFWAAVQVDYRSNIRGLGEGTYRLGTWYVTAREPSDSPPGAGTVLSIDQELGKKIIAFLRYEYQGENLLTPDVEFESLTGTKSTLRLGVGIPGPFKRLPDDYMGLGLAWGKPAESAPKDSYVGEFFYRFQVESAAQISFSIQAIRSSTIFFEVLVFSLRLRFEF